MEHWRMYHPALPAPLAACAGTPALRRLAWVGMNCGCEYTSLPLFRALRPYSRLDHSLGTGLIVWHFTRDPAQALAGLLHDIATPVFAHTVDFLDGDPLGQEATEAGTRALIADSPELQALLTDLGLGTEDVCDYHRYPLADCPSPRLCADRLEYTLGNALNYGFCSPAQIRRLYGDITVGSSEDGRPELVFRTREAGEAFAMAALRCARVYAGDGDRYAMQRLAELLRLALAAGVLRRESLHATEPEVIALLAADSRTAPLWRDFRALSRVERVAEPDGDCRRVRAKKRFVDPLVMGAGRVSELSPAFADSLRQFLEESQDVWLRGVSSPQHRPEGGGIA